MSFTSFPEGTAFVIAKVTGALRFLCLFVQSFPVIIKSKQKHKLLSNILPIQREITSEWKDRTLYTEMNNLVIGGTGENSKPNILWRHTSLSIEGPVITLMAYFLFCTTSPMLLCFSELFHRKHLVHKIKTSHSRKTYSWAVYSTKVTDGVWNIVRPVVATHSLEDSRSSSKSLEAPTQETLQCYKMHRAFNCMSWVVKSHGWLGKEAGIKQWWAESTISALIPHSALLHQLCPYHPWGQSRRMSQFHSLVL